MTASVAAKGSLNEQAAKSQKKFEIPDIYVILGGMIILVAIADSTAIRPPIP